MPFFSIPPLKFDDDHLYSQWHELFSIGKRGNNLEPITYRPHWLVVLLVRMSNIAILIPVPVEQSET